MKGCSPLTVSVTDILGGPTAQYLYDADTCVTTSPKYDPTLCPPTSNTTSTTHTYTQPGTYSLVQVVASQIPRGDTILIEVLPPQPPEYKLTLCNNLGVAIDITDTHYDQFLIDYGDGSPPTSNSTHSYAAVGNYAVSVSGFFNNGPSNCGDSTVVINPVSTIPAATISQVTVINQGPSTGFVQIDYSLPPNVDYILQTSVNGTSNFIGNRPLSGDSILVRNLNTRDSIYCFRIAARDYCNGTRANFSNTVCTNSLDVDVQEGQNQINWNTFVTPQFGQFEITKDGAMMGSPITDSNVRSSLDTDVECNVLYCYQLSTDYTDGGRSVSATRCVTGSNNLPPPQITSLTASVMDNSITLDWELTAPINFYRVFRSVNGGDFESIGQGTTLPFVDQSLRPQINRYCYYIIYQNSCGNQSEPSITACAIKLSGVNDQNKQVSLNWSPYAGWGNGIANYELEIRDELGALVGPPINLGSTAMNYEDPITPNRQCSQYRIVAVSNDPVPLRSYSNVINMDIPIQIFVPNSFTPNNDGLNDIFRAKGLFINEFSMEIYSQWGELLFHTTELDQGWDGVYSGSLSPEGTYVYKIQASDLKGRPSVISGTVHLLRKGF